MAAVATRLRDYIVVTIRLQHSKSGAPKRIRVYPAGRKSNVIYATLGHKLPDRTRPHRVLWLADGLWTGETVEIAPSVEKMRPRATKWPRGWKGPFKQGPKSVKAAADAFLSAPATFPPSWVRRTGRGKPRRFEWHYSITWKVGRKSKVLDPPIIIIPDP